MAAYDRDTPNTYTNPIVDEQTKYQASLNQAVGYGGNVGSSVTNQVPNTQYANAGLQTTVDPFAPKQANESNADYMQRVTQAYKDQPQPTLTAAQEAAGAQVQFVRTGASGKGEYKIVYPIGVQFDKTTGQPITPNVPTNSTTASSVSVPLFTPVATASNTASTLKSDAQIAAETLAANQKADRQSAYDLLFQQFNQYGLSALVTPLKDLITSGASPSEFTIRLRETDAYKKRFAANADRIKNGLKAIDEATYLGLEDQYQNVMRNYGLPESYYARGDMGTQEGFNKFIANDVSSAELEDRIMTAQSRVINSNPEVLASLKSFYPDITNGDILAYTLDPTKALTDIKRKVTAAEIGGAAIQSGLGITGARAGELGSAGITKAQAQQGFETIGGGLQRGSQLASIYGESPYTQTTAEQEVFGLSGKMDAKQQRQKITGLEKATFGGQTGASTGALARDRAGAY